MLPLVLVRIVEPLVLVEIPIDLLDLWHFPAVMLLSLSKAVVLRASKYFGLAAGGELVACIVELLPQLFFDFLTRPQKPQHANTQRTTPIQSSPNPHLLTQNTLNLNHTLLP